jgi:RNase P/RNase MRP subunit POP5
MKSKKRRYIFVLKFITAARGDQLLGFFKDLFGTIKFYQAQPVVVFDSPEWTVIRVNHKYVTELRATICAFGEPGGFYTLLVSGSIRGLIRGLGPRKEGERYTEALRQRYLNERLSN